MARSAEAYSPTRALQPDTLSAKQPLVKTYETETRPFNERASFIPLPLSSLKEFNMALPFHTAYGPKNRVLLECPEKPFGRTKQSFRDESDINNIVARFIKTGTLEFVRKNEPRYGDVIGADFQAAQNIIATANSMFSELPAKLRGRFDNDPAAFFNFIQDPASRDEARTLGLLKPEVAPAAPAAGAPTPPPVRSA